MCDAQCADEYCARIYSEAKMKHKARVSRFLFVSNLFPSIFSLNTNLGFLASFKAQAKKKTNENSLEKRLLCCAMMMMTLMTTTTLRKEDERCCA